MEDINTKEASGGEDSLVHDLSDQFENDLCEQYENALKFEKGGDLNIANEVENVYAKYWNLRKARTTEVEELKTTLSNLKNELMKLDSCKRELEETLKQRSDVKVKKENELKKEIQSLKSECKKKKKVIESLKEDAKPHPNDIAIIDKNRKCLKLHKDFTGIKWDYSATNDSSSVGVVFNAKKHYIKRFSYSAKEGDMLWNEIEAAAMSETSSQTSNNLLTGEK